ncbi:major facilitator superfamily domain-containing protein [Dipodascopsis tothii]|uniref:major facilitator superfamily domain-containing protein n=1 Tax=Dipodascopsis tothii TaxID=44089 RepID=UPI0034CF540D
MGLFFDVSDYETFTFTDDKGVEHQCPIEVEDYEPPKWRRFLGFFWDTWTMPPVKRHYLQKLDFFIFAYSLASYIVKALDQNNFSNAYVSGMSDDLHLMGQERNLFTTLFNMGYLTGSVPNQLMINRIRPSYWIPFCEFIWGVMTMVIAGVNSARAIYGIRFVAGYFESSAFPSFNLLLGSWYAPEELGKRMALFEMSSSAASMFSGYIMTGIYATMNGAHGIAAWRWMFIIDGVITLPIALIGIYFLPDFPTTTRAHWMQPWEKEYGLRRMATLGRKPQKKLTWEGLKEIFLRPTIYVATVPYTCQWFAPYTSYFNLWLKALGTLTVEQINLIPTGGSGLAVISAYIFPMISDRYNCRWPIAIGCSAFGLLGAILLSIWNLPEAVIMFANIIPNAGAAGQPLTVAWMHENFQNNTELRSMIVGFGNVINYAMTAWLPLVLFPTPSAPHYKVGYQFSAMFYALHMISVYLFTFYIRWYHRKHNMVLNEFGLPVQLDEMTEEGHVVVMRDEDMSDEVIMSNEKKPDYTVSVEKS